MKERYILSIFYKFCLIVETSRLQILTNKEKILNHFRIINNSLAKIFFENQDTGQSSR